MSALVYFTYFFIWEHYLLWLFVTHYARLLPSGPGSSCKSALFDPLVNEIQVIFPNKQFALLLRKWCNTRSVVIYHDSLSGF